MVNKPSRSVFKQRAVRMYLYCLLMFDCLVLTCLTQSSRVIEEASSNGLEMEEMAELKRTQTNGMFMVIW